jgi:hypothetical protein
MTTVPGELFAVGSDEVQADAYATPVKLAKLIGLYARRTVLGLSAASDLLVTVTVSVLVDA